MPQMNARASGDSRKDLKKLRPELVVKVTENVSKSKTAVRIHSRTSCRSVRCTQARSQLQNKEKALVILKAKLLIIAQNNVPKKLPRSG